MNLINCEVLTLKAKVIKTCEYSLSFIRDLLAYKQVLVWYYKGILMVKSKMDIDMFIMIT